MQRIEFTLLILTVLLLSGMEFAYASPVEIQSIYTETFYDKFLHSFKIVTYDEPFGPYEILVESDRESKIIKESSMIHPNSWVQWFAYIKASDPNSIKVGIVEGE